MHGESKKDRFRLSIVLLIILQHRGGGWMATMSETGYFSGPTVVLGRGVFI